MKEFLSVIRSSQLFLGITEEEIAAMLTCLDTKTESFPKDTFLLRAGDTTESIGLVLSGSSVLNVSVSAETPVIAMFLNVKRVLNICPSACEHHSRIIRNLLGVLAEKNLHLEGKLTHTGQRTTRAKLMSYLSAEAQRLEKYEFDIPFSRQQLADYLAVERSGLSLELGKLRREGLIDFHKSHFVMKV